MDPRGVTESQLDLYEAGSYAALSATIAPAAEDLVAAAGLHGGERVLDAGAGDGTLSVLAARAGGVPTGCDLSAVQLGRAKDRVADLMVVRADVEQLPFADSCFDAVVSNFAAVSAPDPDRTAGEQFRVCRPGGRAERRPPPCGTAAGPATLHRGASRRPARRHDTDARARPRGR